MRCVDDAIFQTSVIVSNVFSALALRPILPKHFLRKKACSCSLPVAEYPDESRSRSFRTTAIGGPRFVDRSLAFSPTTHPVSSLFSEIGSWMGLKPRSIRSKLDAKRRSLDQPAGFVRICDFDFIQAVISQSPS
jgi:hypothetical protein